MPYHFRNFVFEGGGVKGIAYLGALEELQKRGIIESIERVGGTSAGAIMAIMAGLNYSINEIRDILWNLNFNNFLDDTWGYVRDAKRLVDEFGWYKGDFFRNWIEGLVKDKTGNSESTFTDVHKQKDERGFKNIYLCGSNLSTHFSEVFSYDHTPSVCFADAARISMSIPLFFTAKRSFRGDVYVDGGVHANYPIKLFDREKYVRVNRLEPEYYTEHNKQLRKDGKSISKYVYNKETLGFRLDSEKEIAVFRDHAEPEREKIDDLFSFIKALIVTVLESQQDTHLHDDDWQRTIYIDTLGVGTTQFDLSDDKKDELIKSGQKGVQTYFDWYDKSDAVNK